jgi:hypothetical protein
MFVSSHQTNTCSVPAYINIFRLSLPPQRYITSIPPSTYNQLYQSNHSRVMSPRTEMHHPPPLKQESTSHRENHGQCDSRRQEDIPALTLLKASFKSIIGIACFLFNLRLYTFFSAIVTGFLVAVVLEHYGTLVYLLLWVWPFLQLLFTLPKRLLQPIYDIGSWVMITIGKDWFVAWASGIVDWVGLCAAGRIVLSSVLEAFCAWALQDSGVCQSRVRCELVWE